MNNPEKYATLRKGLLEFLILRIVSSNKVYTADILERLSETDFATQEGTLYPLLSRMRRDNLLDYEWQESGLGPPRKYYKLTEIGQQELADFQDYWQALTRLIEALGEQHANREAN
jgi:PadR family transcriptional regulator PadR